MRADPSEARTGPGADERAQRPPASCQSFRSALPADLPSRAGALQGCASPSIAFKSPFIAVHQKHSSVSGLHWKSGESMRALL